MTFITALIAVIKAIPALESLFQSLISEYVRGQTASTLSKIADAAALAARATTDEERYAASAAWQLALQRTRQL